MTDRTPQQVSDELRSLAAKAINIVQGTISGATNPGGTIAFTYRNPIDGQTYTAEGTAWNQCSPSQVSALKLEDGSWVLVGAHESATVREVVHTDRRARIKKPKEFGKIKILYSTIEGDQRVFWIGGDRATPKRIAAIPRHTRQYDAGISNLGAGDLYIVGLRWEDADSGVIHTQSIGAQSWEKTDRKSSDTEYFGNGFWSGLNSDGGLRLLDTSVSESPPGADPYVRTETHSYAFGSEPGSGSSYYHVTSSPIFSGPGSSTYTQTFSYSSGLTHYSIYQGVLSEHAGTQSHQSSSSGITTFNVHRQQTSVSGSSSGTHLIDAAVPIFPGLTRSWTELISDSGSGGDGSYVSTYNKVSSLPRLVEVGKGAASAIYQLYTSVVTDTFSNYAYPFKLVIPGSPDITLGGDLPQFFGGGLIGSRYFKIQAASPYLDLAVWDVDVYELGADTTKKTIKAKVTYRSKPGMTIHGASYHP